MSFTSMRAKRWRSARLELQAAGPRVRTAASKGFPTLARLNLTRSRLFGAGLALASLAFAACGGHSTTPTPVASVTAVPTSTGSAPAALSSPCSSTLGVAYEPDGGNGNGFTGVQVTHFEDNGEHLCSAVTPTTPISGVRFGAPVGPIAFSLDFSDSLALLFDTSTNGFALAQDVFGASIAQLVPAGAPYDLSAPATPVPVTSGSPVATASLTPALITDATSVTILDDGSLGVGLVVSPNTSPQSIVGLTSLTNAPPQFGNSVPFVGSTNTLMQPSSTSFGNIISFTDSTGISDVLVRGTTDLVSIGVKGNSTGYQFNVESEDTKLGTNVPLRGVGRMAFSTISATRALVGGTSGGTANRLTLVTGLPAAVTETSSITLPGTINSIAFAPQFGTFAAVGTSAGIVIVSGVNTSTLGIASPFGSTVQAYAPTFTNCNGTTSTLTNIASVGFSADLKYLVALGTASGVSCTSGNNASIVAIPFDGETGATPAPSSIATPTPAPSGSPAASPFPKLFQQNNVIAPPANADYFVVH